MKGHDRTPSLKDYAAFHGMLCKPDTAGRCIESFQDGAILFGTQDEYEIAVASMKDNKCANYDVNNIPFLFNIWTYYLLVVLSFTGFSSLLGFTKVIEAVECVECFDGSEDDRSDVLFRFKRRDNKHFESTASKNNFRIPPQVLEYVIDRSFALGPKPLEQENKDLPTIEKDDPLVSDESLLPELILLRRFEYDFGGFLSVMMLHFMCTNGRLHLVEIFCFNRESVIARIGRLMLQPLYIARRMLLKLQSCPQPVNNTKKTI